MRSSQEQNSLTAKIVEGESLPCVFVVAIRSDEPDLGIGKNYKLKNLGRGPALNVRWKFQSDQNFLLANSLASDGEMNLQIDTKAFINGGDPIVCEFESVSHRRYVSETALICGKGPTFHLQHTFRKVEHPTASI